jgi:DNA-3-methyladenine glycosylase
VKKNRLPGHYYQHHDVLHLSCDLLGKFLLTHINGATTGGMIIETEAYLGIEDKASHAFGGRRTPRNEAMYGDGGHCYVYLCYGIHRLFNIVTHTADIPHAILVRAIEPVEGISVMLQRRSKEKVEKTLCSGPGSLCQALGIDLRHNGVSLQGPEIWIEDRGTRVAKGQIVAGPRVGIAYAGEHAHLPWRFRLIR